MNTPLQQSVSFNAFLRFKQMFKAALNGKARRFPFDNSCKPNKSSDIKETNRPSDFSALQYLKTMFEKFRRFNIQILLWKWHFCELRKQKLNQFPVIFGAYLLC